MSGFFSLTSVLGYMRQQLRVPFYPVLIVAADIGLAGVLLLFAPILGLLMATAALSVIVAVGLQARGHGLLRSSIPVS